jgi:drug/metabolite transporter (DMT)-like permease
MNMLRILGILLIVAGAAGLVFGGFEYTQTKEVAKIGPLDLKTKEQRRVAIPPLASGAVLAVGAVLLFAGRKKS